MIFKITARCEAFTHQLGMTRKSTELPDDRLWTFALYRWIWTRDQNWLLWDPQLRNIKRVWLTVQVQVPSRSWLANVWPTEFSENFAASWTSHIRYINSFSYNCTGDVTVLACRLPITDWLTECAHLLDRTSYCLHCICSAYHIEVYRLLRFSACI